MAMTRPTRSADASRAARAWPRPRAAPVTATTGRPAPPARPRGLAWRRRTASPGIRSPAWPATVLRGWPAALPAAVPELRPWRTLASRLLTTHRSRDSLANMDPSILPERSRQMTDPPFGFGMPGSRTRAPAARASNPGGGSPLGPLGDPAAARRRPAPVRGPDVVARRPRQLGPGQEHGPADSRGQGRPQRAGQRAHRRSPMRSGWPTCGSARPPSSPPGSARPAWSRSEWVEATLPVWSKLCDPIASRAVERDERHDQR